jgi:hypothetical protein
MGVPVRRAVEALTAATALALLLANPMVAPNGVDGVVVAARISGEDPKDPPPEDPEPCPPNGCGGNHNEGAVRDE